MKIRRPTARQHGDDLLPMINIVFLLLIFFMLAGALRIADPFEIDPPSSRSEAGATPEDTVIVMDREGRLAFDGITMNEDGLHTALMAYLADRPDGVIRLKADARVSTPRVVKLMERLRDAGVRQLVLLTVAATP